MKLSPLVPLPIVPLVHRLIALCLFSIGFVLLGLMLSLLVLLGCQQQPLRQWHGRPAEEFTVDRTKCYQEPVFEACMKAIGWKEAPGYQPDK